MSLVLRGHRNSVFTTHLLEALRGEGPTAGDGLVRVFDVFNHVVEGVRRSVPGRQRPIFRASDMEENFPVALEGPTSKVGSAGSTGPGRAPIESPVTLQAVLAELYPSGPREDEIWIRAGGDPSRLDLAGSGRTQWFRALRLLEQGGGGTTIGSLVATALDDFPHHRTLRGLQQGSF